MGVVNDRFIVEHFWCDCHGFLLWLIKIRGRDNSRKPAVPTGGRDNGPGSGDGVFGPGDSFMEFSIVDAELVKGIAGGGEGEGQR